MGTKREDYARREEYARWHVCLRKVTYLSRKAARKAKRLLNRQFRSRKRVYRCRFCSLFHLGELHQEKLLRLVRPDKFEHEETPVEPELETEKELDLD